MSICTSQGIGAKLFSRSLHTWVKGSDFSLQAQLLEKPGDDPHVIVDFEAASAYFVKEDTALLAVTGTLSSADRGILNFAVPADDSLDLLATDQAEIMLRVSESNQTYFVNLETDLTIADQLGE